MSGPDVSDFKITMTFLELGELKKDYIEPYDADELSREIELKPYKKEITSLTIDRPTKERILSVTELPDFFKPMIKLCSLKVSKRHGGEPDEAETIGFGETPTDSPSWTFPGSLTKFTLTDIPLTQSFCNIKTLTDFYFKYDGNVGQSLDTLLTFMRNNPSLELVDLDLGPCFTRAENPVSADLGQLKSLIVHSSADIEHFVPHIRLPKGTQVSITITREQKLRLVDALQLVKRMEGQVTGVRVEADMIRLSGSEGMETSEIYCELDITSVLEWSNCNSGVKDLHIVMPPPGDGPRGPLKESAFSGLDSLTIHRDQRLSDTLSELVSYEGPSPPKRLKIWRCIVPEDFKKELNAFGERAKMMTPVYHKNTEPNQTIPHTTVEFGGGKGYIYSPVSSG